MSPRRLDPRMIVNLRDVVDKGINEAIARIDVALSKRVER